MRIDLATAAIARAAKDSYVAGHLDIRPVAAECQLRIARCAHIASAVAVKVDRGTHHAEAAADPNGRGDDERRGQGPRPPRPRVEGVCLAGHRADRDMPAPGTRGEACPRQGQRTAGAMIAGKRIRADVVDRDIPGEGSEVEAGGRMGPGERMGARHRLGIGARRP